MRYRSASAPCVRRMGGGSAWMNGAGSSTANVPESSSIFLDMLVDHGIENLGLEKGLDSLHRAPEDGVLGLNLHIPGGMFRGS